jgi:two-component system sensor histidine kinase DegS
MAQAADGADARSVSAKEGFGPAESPIAAYARRLEDEAETIDAELNEIELLIGHARAEAARHEGKRSAASDRLATRPPTTTVEGRELTDLAKQIALLTKRAAVMESQIDVLEGKQRALARYRDAIRTISSQLGELDVESTADPSGSPNGEPGDQADGASEQLRSSSVLAAQEELRRQIARSLHDGPVQGLTNIALQAQIVERLANRSPEQAAEEARSLVAMVQATLDITKSFLFDVRPMVLDDLGLVPTLRRTVRERARKSDAVVELESNGQDQRLPGETESSLFRIIDMAVTEYLDTRADRVSVKLDWMDRLAVGIASWRDPAGVDEPEIQRPSGDVPPALAAMIEDRRLAFRPHLAEETLQDIRARAVALGATLDDLDEGSELRLLVPVP